MMWKRVPRAKRLRKFHWWFAWYPVRIGDYIVWGQWVIRRYDPEGRASPGGRHHFFFPGAANDETTETLWW